jgi:hypothetical protein
MSAAAAVQMAEEHAMRKREAQVRKERFLVFCKALCRDLKQRDPAMYARSKSIIMDCTDKRKRKVTGFDFESNMRTRLLDVVGEDTWRRVERDLNKNLAAQETAKRASGSSAGTSIISSNSSNVSLTLSSGEPEQRFATVSAIEHVEDDRRSVTLSSNHSCVELALGGPVDLDEMMDSQNDSVDLDEMMDDRRTGPVDLDESLDFDELEMREAEAKVDAFVSNREKKARARNAGKDAQFIYI